MKKKLVMFFALLVFMAQAMVVTPSAAEAGTTAAVIDGKIANGRVLIPLRAFSEKLGAYVQWDNKDKQAFIHMGGKVIGLGLNKTAVSIGTQMFGYLDVPVTMVNQVTYVPFSFIGSVVGAEVTWNNQLKQANVSYMGQALVIKGKADSRIQLPSTPTQQRLDHLYAKVNEAVHISKYAQKRQQLAGYFTNELINQVIQNNGLTAYDKLYANAFTEPMLTYSSASPYEGILFQYKEKSEKDDFYPGTLTRNIVLEFVDGQWLVSEVRTVVKGI
jgi:Copper amine oxidase N-terminal domain.